MRRGPGRVRHGSRAAPLGGPFCAGVRSPRQCGMVIRGVEARDRDGWLLLRRKLWPDGMESHAREVDRFLEGTAPHPDAVLVAEEGARLVGFAELSVRTFAEGCVTTDVGYLEGWYVEEEHRRRGVGRALQAAGERWALEQGCAEFGSDANARDERSIRAHLACGFEDAGTIRCFRKRLDTTLRATEGR